MVSGNTIPRSRLLSALALFSALAFVLRLTVELPFPLATYLKLEVWEIPVYIVLFTFGAKLSLGVAATVFLLVQAFASGQLPTGPAYNFIAVLSTMAGAIFVAKIMKKSAIELPRSSRSALGLTLSAVAFRVVVMTVVNATVLPMPYPIGLSIPQQALAGILYVTAIFNTVVAAYSIVIALPVASRIAPLTLKALAAQAPSQRA